MEHQQSVDKLGGAYAGSTSQDPVIYGVERFHDPATPINLFYLDQDAMPHGGLHAHDYFQVCYVHYGTAVHRIGNVVMEVGAGDAFVIPPEVFHAFRASGVGKAAIFLCDFMPSFVNEHFCAPGEHAGIFDFAYLRPFLVREEEVRPAMHVTGARRHAVERILLAMLDEHRHRRVGFGLCLKALLLELLVTLAREHSGNADSAGRRPLSRDSIHDAIQFIQERFRDAVSLADVCAYAGLSPTTFCRHFKQVTGMTFLTFLRELRIQAAVELLSEARLRITDIAFDVGFRDVSHFNRVFRLHVGVSPREYRRRARNGARASAS